VSKSYANARTPHPRTIARAKPKPNLRSRVAHLAVVRPLSCVARGKAAPSDAAHVRPAPTVVLGGSQAIATPFLSAPPVMPTAN
jgi:hypothetical protein